jgi:hypothetical protein
VLHWLVLRPTFELSIEVSRDEAIHRLGSAYREIGNPQVFFMHGEYGELHLPKEQHRLWSPHLSFYITQDQDASIVRGRFAPRPDVWTLIWIFYLLLAFTAFFSLIMHLSQLAIGETGSWHWLTIAASLTIGLIYLIANIGQQWSADQMELLKAHLIQLLDNKVLFRTGESQPVSPGG